MRLLLINPSNPLVGIAKLRENRWNYFRVWKPLNLALLAGMTPPEWEIAIVDENLGTPDYGAMPRPDLVGVTACSSQANRAYRVAAGFRGRGVPVVMGGIHGTLRLDEAIERVDSVVTGEAEGVWPQVLEDAWQGCLERSYDGGRAEIKDLPFARHDLLANGYAFGAIQTTRGCPLNCAFCSVRAFSGGDYRQRPISHVIEEFKSIPERHVLIVDDNLIGTQPEHIARAKELFRALAAAKLRKQWAAQVTINFADDEELLALAEKAGCRGLFIGLESPDPEGLGQLRKRFNLQKGRDFRSSVRRIQRHNMLVAGSFILGLDVHGAGVGRAIADAAHHYGVDVLNVLLLTPLPGTRVWDQMKAEDRFDLDRFPEDWDYYTLTFPVVRYRQLSTEAILDELISCGRSFYSMPRILSRLGRNVWQRRKPLFSLACNLSYRKNIAVDCKVYDDFRRFPAGGRSTGGCRQATGCRSGDGGG